MLACGHSVYQTKHETPVHTDQSLDASQMSLLRKYVLRFVSAGAKGCATGCITECTRELQNADSPPIPQDFFHSLQCPSDEELEDKELFLFSGYLGKVNVKTTTLDKICKLGDKYIRIKVIDAQQNALNMNLEYSIMDVVGCEPLCIDSNENEYIEYCKLIAYSRILTMENREGKDKPIIDTFIELLSHTHRSRAETDYPDLFTDTLTLGVYKDIYHSLLTKLCPVDVFFNVYNYFHFLYETLGVVSVNNLNTILCIVNVPELENAYWTGQYAVFGNGLDLFYPLTSIDVIGHELSHGLVDGTAKLVYRGESGALNESFADIFGSLFESYMYNRFNSLGANEMYGNSDWYIGEDIIKSGTRRNLRSMCDPHTSYTSQPKFIGDVFYIDPTSQYDHGGVHINSGITNYCFYLVSMQSDVVGTSKLFYECLCNLQSSSTFTNFSTTLTHHAKLTNDVILINAVQKALTTVKLIVSRRRFFFINA